MSATTNLGKVSVTPKGAWAITNTYEILDIVTSGGSSYLAKQDVPTGVPLSNTSYWIMIAEKGDGGEVTSASASISGGYGTPGVSVTAGGTAHERTLAFAFTNLRGEKGETGNGIDSVYKTGTSGLVDTYTILFTDGSTYEFEVNNGTASIDDTLTKSGWAADAKAVGDTKASIDGFYETMGVGVADNLTPYSEDSGATQDIPFIAQGTGCGNGESVVDTGSYLQFKKKLGNTVCVNQLVEHGNFDAVTGWMCQNGGTITVSDNIGTCSFASNTSSDQLIRDISLINGHTFLISLDVKQSSASAGLELFGGMQIPVAASTATTEWQTLRGISSETTYPYWILRNSTSDPSLVVNLRNAFVIDLTRWFGSNDRVPSDLLSHPENWGRYYAGSLAYNAGTLESADGSILTSIHRNIWDEEYLTGYYNSSGVRVNDATQICTKNKIAVIPNTQYYLTIPISSVTSSAICWYDASGDFLRRDFMSTKEFTAPADAHFMNINFGTLYGTTYKHDITISLYYPGESGYDQYYPFSVLAEVDTGSEVLRSAGAVADEKTPDGTITRRVGYHTFDGTENFSITDLGTCSQVSWLGGIGVVAVSSPYRSNRFVYGSAGLGNVWGSTGYSRIYFGLPNTVTTNAEAQAWFAANPTTLYYELATPTTEQGTAFAENIPCDDFGSMYWTQTKGIPQGNEIFYPVDYKASIDTLYNRVEGDMSRIVIDDDLADYNTKAEDAATYATKEAAGGVLRQVLAVKAEIDFANTAYADLASATWSNYSTNIYSASVVADAKEPTSDWSTAVAISTKYPITPRNGLAEGTIAIKQGNVLFYSTTVGSVANVPSAMSGVLLAYEKASS